MQIITDLSKSIVNLLPETKEETVTFTPTGGGTPSKTFSLADKKLKILSSGNQTEVDVHNLLFGDNTQEEDIEAYVALGGSLEMLFQEFETMLTFSKSDTLGSHKLLDSAGKRLVLAANFYRKILTNGTTHLDSANLTTGQIASFYAYKYFNADTATSIETRLCALIAPDLDSAIQNGLDEIVLFYAKANKEQTEQLVIKCLKSKNFKLACELVDLCQMSKDSCNKCLTIAIQKRNILSVKTLLSSGANPKSIYTSPGKIPILHHLIRRNQFEIAKLLVSFGADINRKNRYGKTPLQRAISHGKYDIAFWIAQQQDKNPDVSSSLFELLLKFKNPNTRSNPKAKALFTELLKHKSALEYKSSNTGNTPLHLACKLGLFEEVKLLVNAGASLSEKNKRRLNSLTLAISHGKYDIAFWIAQQQDKNPDVSNSLFQLLAKFKNPNTRSNPKAKALFTELLKHKSALEYKTSKSGSTPLHLACELGLLEEVRLLVNAGASLSEKNKRRLNSLTFAIMHGKYDIALWMAQQQDKNPDFSQTLQLLLLQLSNRQVRNNVEANKLFAELIKYDTVLNDEDPLLGNTPLHIALNYNLVNYANKLLEKGASIILPNYMGVTAYNCGLQHNNNFWFEYCSSIIGHRQVAELSRLLSRISKISEDPDGEIQSVILEWAKANTHYPNLKNILLYALLINDSILFHAVARCLSKKEYQTEVLKLKAHFPDASEHFFADATIGINEAHYQSSDEIPHGKSSATVQDLKKFCQEAKVNLKISTAINTLIDRIEKTTPFLGTPKAGDQAALALWYEKFENLIKECLDLVKNDPIKKKILLVEIEKFIDLCGTGWFNNFVLLKNSFSKDPKDLPAQVKCIAAQFRLRLFQSYARNFTLAMMPHAIGEEAHVFNYLVKKYGKKYGIPGAQIIALNEDPLPLSEETRELLDSIFDTYFQNQYTPTAVIDLIADDLKSGVPHDTFISWIGENAPDDIEVDAENIQIKTPKENIIDSINIQKNTIENNFKQAIQCSRMSFKIIMRFLPPGTNLTENEWTSAEDKKTLLENLKANRLKDLEAREETLLNAIVDQEDVVAFLKKERVYLAPLTKKQAIREEQVAIFTQEMIYGENPRKGIIFFLEKLNILECFKHASSES